MGLPVKWYVLSGCGLDKTQSCSTGHKITCTTGDTVTCSAGMTQSPVVQVSEGDCVTWLYGSHRSAWIPEDNHTSPVFMLFQQQNNHYLDPCVYFLYNYSLFMLYEIEKTPLLKHLITGVSYILQLQHCFK